MNEQELQLEILRLKDLLKITRRAKDNQKRASRRKVADIKDKIRQYQNSYCREGEFGEIQTAEWVVIDNLYNYLFPEKIDITDGPVDIPF